MARLTTPSAVAGSTPVSPSQALQPLAASHHLCVADHDALPSVDTRGVEAAPYRATMPKELGNTSLPDKVAAALVCRLHPNTGLHRKQLCGALNISRNTLDGWLAGKNPPTAENLLLLIDFFDAAFAAEVSGGKILKTPDRTIANKLAEIGRLTRELHNALGSPL